MNDDVIRLARQARAALDQLIDRLEAGGPAAPPPLSDTEKSWRRWWDFMKDVADTGGDLSPEEWVELGAKHGYAAGALGGFFKGNGSMKVDGDRRVLTARGRELIEQYEPFFGKP